MSKTRQGLDELSGPVFSRTDVNLRANSRRQTIAFGDVLREVICIFFVHKINRASAKTTSGHTPTAETGQAFGGLDHDVEFPATDLIKVAEAVVGLAH